MARIGQKSTRQCGRFPHARGDGPQYTQWLQNPTMISPRAWGWPGDRAKRRAADGDFPTRVGMARSGIGEIDAVTGFPHARGDGPTSELIDTMETGISPRAWGWPARFACWESANDGFPHARGDGPPGMTGYTVLAVISPRAWGWPGSLAALTGSAVDFPTRVGMARLLRSIDPQST